MVNPLEIHWKGMKKVHVHPKGTVNFATKYTNDFYVELESYYHMD